MSDPGYEPGLCVLYANPLRTNNNVEMYAMGGMGCRGLIFSKLFQLSHYHGTKAYPLDYYIYCRISVLFLIWSKMATDLLKNF